MIKINTIKGLEHIKDYYYICTCGKVLTTIRTQGAKYKIMSQKTTRQGYRDIGLATIDKRKFFRVHRLVALAYISNPNDKEIVNHISEIKDENHIRNLEWATAKENSNHGTLIERRTGENNSNAKDIEYYRHNETKRYNFKVSCKKKGWDFNNFEEIDSKIKDGYHRKFYYKLK